MSTKKFAAFVCMYAPKLENRVRGHDGELYISGDNRFQITTIPGIRPVLVQKKQVDQANATQRPGCSRPTGADRLSAPMPPGRDDLTVIGADKLGLLDDVRLRRL